jgi:hypothetical protein
LAIGGVTDPDAGFPEGGVDERYCSEACRSRDKRRRGRLAALARRVCGRPATPSAVAAQNVAAPRRIDLARSQGLADRVRGLAGVDARAERGASLVQLFDGAEGAELVLVERVGLGVERSSGCLAAASSCSQRSTSAMARPRAAPLAGEPLRGRAELVTLSPSSPEKDQPDDDGDADEPAVGAKYVRAALETRVRTLRVVSPFVVRRGCDEQDEDDADHNDHHVGADGAEARMGQKPGDTPRQFRLAQRP